MTPPELANLIKLPETMYLVWGYFIDLHNARTSTGYGINPITYSDIYAYFGLLDMQPDDWEVKAIRRLDSIAINAFIDEQKKEQNKAKQKSK